jgi:trk system potassium uptake protein TrkA
VIVGAGAVGSYLAARLSSEGQDVILIESDERRAAELQDQLDVLVLTGNGASPATLEEAEVSRSDLLIAVSNSDGVNALACHAARLLGVRRTVARIEDQDLAAGIGDLGVDVVIDPGEMAAREVLNLVRERGVSDLVEFAGGALTLLGGIVRGDSSLLGRSLAELRAEETGAEWAIAAVVRQGETIPVRGDTVIQRHDHVLVMVRTADVEFAHRLLGLDSGGIERTIVLGATRVAELSTELLLNEGLEVVLVDADHLRCRELADAHPRALVIHGDPTDPDVLAGLGLSDTDAVAALSGWDDVNLTGCLVAKALGVATAVSRFHRLSYVGLLIGTGIDASVSSRLSASNAILRFVRRGRIHSVATFKDTDAEALDIEVEPQCAADGSLVRDLPLPTTAVIGGVARDGYAFVPRGDTEIRSRDRLIVFAPPGAIHDVEAMCAR